MLQHWRDWFRARQQASTMVVEEILLVDAAPWGVQSGPDGDPDHVGRPDGRFFSVVAVRIHTGSREVMSWPQLILKEATKPGEEGIIVLFRDALTGDFLVQAKAEPGNTTPGRVLLAPSLQASRANLEQVHGGKRPPRAELLDGEVIDGTPLFADGARFLGKRNLYLVKDVDSSSISLSENERWFTLTELREALFEGGCVNEHLAHALLFATLQGG